jgi:hypothetical protein
MTYFFRYFFAIAILTACTTLKVLTFEANISDALKEVSAIEKDLWSNTYWVIEDSGNSNTLFQLNAKGKIISSIEISNAKNKDWEDLSMDTSGHIYIGDIGNNNEKRKVFQIYKVHHNDLTKPSAIAEIIEFTFPDGHKTKDMEGFFIFSDHFYVFTKEAKHFSVLKVPNSPGRHSAELVNTFNLKGKDNKITSAAISPDRSSIVLLNHDKLWKLSGFETDDFFSGKIECIDFKHTSQKEGIGFGSNVKVYITDERKGTEGGNIYSYDFK